MGYSFNRFDRRKGVERIKLDLIFMWVIAAVGLPVVWFMMLSLVRWINNV